MDEFIKIVISAACEQAGIAEETLKPDDLAYLEEVFDFSKDLAFRRLSKIKKNAGVENGTRF
ncbi:hypothetical protein [Methylophilus sp. DW102]|uniref:hypothetical protein n=1 Tax=Methylophilus sp. DW102 TaxID=3095607 RepID=UPI003086AC6E|nr:hypothetical protein MTDW_26390 [Methylophilus sp. DW102]